MDNDDRTGPQAAVQFPFGHLIPGTDPRTPEERAEAQRRENARRVKDWWKK